MGQVVSLVEIESLVSKARSNNQSIVLANGHFDLLHVGHVRYLKAAKREGDILIVGVNSDDSTRRLKGVGRPIVNAVGRAELVAALGVVDLAVIFQGDDVSTLVTLLRPDVHCKGTDYTEEDVPERGLVCKIGGRTRVVGDPKVHGTSDLINTVINRFSN